MKKIVPVVLSFTIIFSLLGAFLGSDTFSVRTYMESLGNAPSAPSIPNPDFGDGSFFEQAKEFFIFSGNILAYPIRLIVYFFECVSYIFGGLL